MTSSSNAVSPRLVFLALSTVQILFGINYVVSKILVGVFPPLVWASLRIIVSAAVMMAVAGFSGRPHPRDGRRFFLPLILFALLGAVINQSAFLVGLRYTTSTNSAILNTLIPVFTLLIVTLRGQEPITPARALGFISALCGVLVLRKVENYSFSDVTLIGDLLTILNCFSFALFLAFGKTFIEKHDRVWTTAWFFVYGSVGITMLAVPDYASFSFPPMTPALWGAVAFSVLGATLLAYFLNSFALAHARSSHVAVFIYLQPVVASILAWMWMNETVTLRTVASWGLILTGMMLGLTKTKERGFWRGRLA